MFKQLFLSLFGRSKTSMSAETELRCSAPDAGPWRVDEWHTTDQLVLQSSAGPSEVALVVLGNFQSSEQRLAYANSLATWLNDQVASCTTATPLGGLSTEPADMDDMPWEADESTRLPKHAASQRRMSLGEAPLRRPAHRQPPAPIADEKPFGAFGCHCELGPDETPDACAIDLNKRDLCQLAQDGRTRNSCEYWRPITLRRAA